MDIHIQVHLTLSQPLNHQAMLHEGRDLACLLKYIGIFIYAYSISYTHIVMYIERKNTQIHRHCNKRLDKWMDGQMDGWMNEL